jgi:hypothetical protein
MVNPSNAVLRRGCLALLALGGLLLAAEPAAAQYVIAPDRSSVNLGPGYRLPPPPPLTVQPIVVQGNRYVRLNINFSGTVPNYTTGYPGTGFMKPFYANDRARGANFFGIGYQGPTIAAPFTPWW